MNGIILPIVIIIGIIVAIYLETKDEQEDATPDNQRICSDYDKTAYAVTCVTTLLDAIESNKASDTNDYLTAAWICRVGFTDLMEKNGWLLSNTLYITIKGSKTKVTLHEVLMITIGRLSYNVGQLDNEELKNKVMDILDKGASFYQVDSQIPQTIRRKFKD